MPSLVADRTAEEPVVIPAATVEAAVEAAEGDPIPEHLL